MRSTQDAKRGATRFDLSDPTVYYIGYADYAGGNLTAAWTVPAESAPVWTIKKITLDAGLPISVEWTEPGAAAWSDRASETYI